MNPDIGNSHVIAWHLWRTLHNRACIRYRRLTWLKTTPTLRFDPEDWSRYDGELL